MMFDEYFDLIIQRVQEARKHLPRDVSLHVLYPLNSIENLAEKAKSATRDYATYMEKVVKDQQR